MRISVWIEAMRLRTLPVAVASIFCAFAYACMDGNANWLPGILCLVFAVLAQISSNFANEYYDAIGGLDKKGRVGPRRGVTEGDITPKAMKIATFAVLAAACVIGCSLIYWGGWWLIAVGIAVAVGVVTYSAGPYPLSHHGLGEVAVICFFGIIPVNMTYYLMCGTWSTEVALASLSMGLMGANVLILNNYRDVDDDRAVGKSTLCVKWGRKTMLIIYLLNGIVAVALMISTWQQFRRAWYVIPLAYLAINSRLCLEIKYRDGARLNPMLGATSLNMLGYALAFLLCAYVTHN